MNALSLESWPNPTLSSAANVCSSDTGPSGVKMSGPYSWVPPNYWLDPINWVSLSHFIPSLLFFNNLFVFVFVFFKRN